MSKVTNDTGSLFKTYSIIWLLCGITAGSILGLVLVKMWGYKTVRRYILNLLFTAIIPLIFFTIASSIASLEKSEKLGKLFVVVIGVFLYRSYFGSIDDGWRAAFSYSSGYYYFYSIRKHEEC
jgi:Na+/H+-dicarboxylate symporter